MGIAILLGIIAAFGLAGVRVLPEYERGVVFRFGRYVGVRSAGLKWIIPGVDRMVRIGLREIVMDVPSQE
ncbi:MAG: slipin family protein, partial [Deltaproteobacteria bacterium]|nr:slipin family protein [Deltaproteobacteria bacterium]